MYVCMYVCMYVAKDIEGGLFHGASAMYVWVGAPLLLSLSIPVASNEVVQQLHMP